MSPSLVPRVAYFPDSFHEVNGVAHTSRHFEAFARRRNLPFLCVRAGDRAESLTEDGNVWTLELPRGFLSFALEKDLRFDPAFLRHIPLIEETLARFKPDLIHITGPSEVGMLGMGLAHHLGLPLAASWHTNVHEYAGRRSEWLLKLLPAKQSAATEQKIEDLTLAAAARFYATAQVLFAPNLELCATLEQMTGRPCHRMPRGVDAVLFDPAKRRRAAGEKERVLGFVGRLSVEKNIAGLVAVQDELERMGVTELPLSHCGPRRRRGLAARAIASSRIRGRAARRRTVRRLCQHGPVRFSLAHRHFRQRGAGGAGQRRARRGHSRWRTEDDCRDGVTGRIVRDEDFAAAVAAILADPAKHAAMRKAARRLCADGKLGLSV